MGGCGCVCVGWSGWMGLVGVCAAEKAGHDCVCVPVVCDPIQADSLSSPFTGLRRMTIICNETSRGRKLIGVVASETCAKERFPPICSEESQVSQLGQHKFRLKSRQDCEVRG